MSSQLSAQAITAQTAITRMSIRRWSILPWQRGSSTTLKCRTRPSMDMILSSPARGHVIIHQARASDRNFMRLPCGMPYVKEGDWHGGDGFILKMAWTFDWVLALSCLEHCPGQQVWARELRLPYV